MSKIKNIIFDLDGTLWDSRLQIIEAWKESVPNLVLDKEQLNDLMGKTQNAFIHYLFPNCDHHKAQELMHKCELAEVDYLGKHGANLYNGVLETIQKLSLKYKLFIVSNCQCGYVESFLNYYNLNDYFSDHICSGDTKLSKPENIAAIMKANNLEQSNTCYVGDTTSDYSAAQYNNIFFIWTCYGFGKDINCKYILKDFQNIENVIESIK